MGTKQDALASTHLRPPGRVVRLPTQPPRVRPGDDVNLRRAPTVARWLARARGL